MSLEECYTEKFKIEFNSDSLKPRIYLDGSSKPLNLISAKISYEAPSDQYTGDLNHLSLLYLDDKGQKKYKYIQKVLFDTETNQTVGNNNHDDEGLVYD